MKMMIWKWFPYLVITLTGVLLYHGVIKTYAFTDAYEFTLNASNSNFIEVFLQGGRPLYGLAMKWSFMYVQNVDSIYLLRTASLLLAIGFSCLFYIFLRKEGFKSIDSLMMAVIILLSPSMSIKIVWSVLWIMPLIMTLAFFAGTKLLQYQRKGLLSDLIASILLGLVVLLTYQPIFTFSLIPIFINWIRGYEKGLIKVGLIHVATYIVYYIIFRTYLFVFEVPPLERSGISLDILGRLQWFYSDALLRSITWNLLFQPNGIRWIYRSIVITLVLFFLLKNSRFKPKGFLKLSAFLIIFSIGAFLPNILSSDIWVSYRTMDALIFLPIIFIWYGLTNLSLKKWLRYSLYFIFLALSFAMAFYNINNGFIAIQVAEYNAIDKKIASLEENTDALLFIPPPLKLVKDGKILKRVITDEFGRLSSSSSWVPEPMTKLMLRSNGKNRNLELIINNYGNSAGSYNATIDVQHLFMEEIKK